MPAVKSSRVTKELCGGGVADLFRDLGAWRVTVHDMNGTLTYSQRHSDQAAAQADLDSWKAWV